MARIEDDSRVRAEPSSPGAPPYEALFPNLDKVSPASFRRGTVSRRRIVRSLAGLAVVAVAITLIIVGTAVL